MTWGTTDGRTMFEVPYDGWRSTGGGQLFVEVAVGTAPQAVGIRGLDRDRHKELCATEGEILVFGLVRDKSEANFKGGLLTTFYVP